MMPSFAIDAVYLWANASDPEWLATRRAFRDEHAAEGGKGSDEACRFRDHGELRYSLRSVERYAPFLRRVHVVHGGAPPSWLRADDPTLHLVRDDDLFPDPALAPSYNSQAIEAFLHRIPGLAEHYVYFNDDNFLCAPLFPADLFDPDGTAVIQMSPFPMPSYHATEDAWLRSMWRTFEALGRHMGERYLPTFRTLTPLALWARAPLPPECFWNLPAHVAQPFRKSIWPRVHEVFADEVRALTRHRFRHPEVIGPNIAATYLSLEEKLARFVREARSRHVWAGMKPEDLDAARRVFLDSEERRPIFGCLNDTAKPSVDWGAYVADILGTLFPTPSRWERA
ncbi:Stealth CR1 domain-containing protein [Sorangium sp. So ce185]|uniref:Stealth CR1 domain-containing protein n=1 Tax=Sorangium sp. So ce185 TaxID=3133287 RepID=UPI003F5E2C5A